MSRGCLLARCNDVRLQGAASCIMSPFRREYRRAGAVASDDSREIDGVQRPKSFLTQHELVW